MHEWIALDGVKSTTIPGLAVLAYTPPLLSPRSREETVIAGRLTALTQRDWQREPADLEITLALVGESMQAMLALWQAQALPWLYDATRLELDAMQGYFFRGAVTEVSIEEQTEAWLRARAVFRCNPPLPLRLRSGQAGWTPEADTPIPQQLTAQTATASGSFSAPWLLDHSWRGRRTRKRGNVSGGYRHLDDAPTGGVFFCAGKGRYRDNAFHRLRKRAGMAAHGGRRGSQHDGRDYRGFA